VCLWDCRSITLRGLARPYAAISHTFPMRRALQRHRHEMSRVGVSIFPTLRATTFTLGVSHSANCVVFLTDKRLPQDSFLCARLLAQRRQRHMSVDFGLELEFIREFAVAGMLHGVSDTHARREHIRVSIYKLNLVEKPFRDTGFNYAQAYQHCFGMPLEMRRTVRVKPQLDSALNR
jgi:hypothetical protein